MSDARAESVARWTKIAIDLVALIAPLGLAWYSLKLFKAHFADQNKERQQRATRALYKIWVKLGRPGSLPYLDEHEETILTDVVFPDQITIGVDDIGGLREIKETLWETILLPLQHPQLFDSSTAFAASAPAATRHSGPPAHNLLSIPLGVLFYGPPGTGKTLMAKAIARECNATFIPVNFSTLENKWFGESQKIARAIFSLARKFAPSIVFIDEVDVFLSARSSGDHGATTTLKGEFMAQWDGLVTDHSAPVLVLGATNRPYDIDPAFLRRMPRQILFDLPGEEERRAILTLLLQDIPLADPGLIAYAAAATADYSGSDLKELCKAAAMQPLREFTRRHFAALARPGAGGAQTRAAAIAAGAVLGTGDRPKPGAGGSQSDDDDEGDVAGHAKKQDAGAAGSNSSASHSAAAAALTGSIAATARALPRVQLRGLEKGDIDAALKSVKATGAESMAHMRRFYRHQQRATGGHVPAAAAEEEDEDDDGAGAGSGDEEEVQVFSTPGAAAAAGAGGGMGAGRYGLPREAAEAVALAELPPAQLDAMIAQLSRARALQRARLAKGKREGTTARAEK